MPGPTDTEFFERADMLDTKVAQGEKQDPAEVADAAFAALRERDDHVVPGGPRQDRLALVGTTCLRSGKIQTHVGANWTLLVDRGTVGLLLWLLFSFLVTRELALRYNRLPHQLILPHTSSTYPAYDFI